MNYIELFTSIDQFTVSVQKALRKGGLEAVAEVDTLVEAMTEEFNSSLDAFGLPGDLPAGENPFEYYTAALEEIVAHIANLQQTDTTFRTDLTNLENTLRNEIVGLTAAPIDSPAFTGLPTVPTPPPGTSTEQIVNAAFVQGAIAALIDDAPGTIDTLNELAAALADDPNFAATMTTQLAGKLNTGDTAVAALRLATARTISLAGDASGAVTFDGSGNVILDVTVLDDSHNHLIGNIDGLQAALAGKLDAGANSVSASKLAIARSIALTGDVTGTVTFDGSANASMVTAVADDSHSHSISTVTGLQAALDGKLGSSGSAANLTNIPAIRLSGIVPDANLSGAYTGVSITGNAGTATKLATARTINGVAFDGTANITAPDATKLPLSGGTLTGALGLPNGTTVNGTVNGLQITNGTFGTVDIGNRNASYTHYNSSTGNHYFYGNAQVQTNLSVGGTITGNGSGLTNVPAASLTGTVPDAVLPASITSSITGNAATATKLATARSINGVAFDGTGNITVTAADPASVTKTGDSMTGNLTLNDSVQLRLGSSADCIMYHNGSHTYIDQNVTGDLYIRNQRTGGAIYLQADSTGGSLQNVLQAGVGADNACVLFASGAARLTTTAAGVSITGTLISSSNVSGYSDIRLKTNIQVIPDALDKIDQLRGVIFDRVDTGERQTGLIANEVQAVLPEAVTELDDEDKTLTLAYGNLAGLFVEATKELRQELNALRTEVVELREEVTQLKKG